MRLALAILAFVCVATITSIALIYCNGHLDQHVALVSLIFGWCIGVFAFLCRKTSVPSAKLTLLDGAMLTVFTLFGLRAFCWLIFFKGYEICVLSPNNLGDMSLHLTYIRYLARGPSFWPENPIFSGTGLHYPLGPDLFNALLALCGVDVIKGLIWVGLGGCFVTWVALHRWGGWFAVAGFLFNGGLAGLHFLKIGHLADFQADVAWKNIPLAMFATQRGLLYAIPVGLMLLTSWRAKWIEKTDAEFDQLPVWLEVLLYSTLPLFHFHTFLFLSALFGYWLIFGTQRVRNKCLEVIAYSFIPASILVALVTGLFNQGAGHPGSLVHITPGWMQERDGFFHFWFLNFGLLPLFTLALLVCILTRYQRDIVARNAADFIFPSVAMFLVTCNVMFAPWEWDNTKLMIWSYLVILPSVWLIVIKPLPLLIRILSCVALFFSGFLSLFGGIDASHRGYPIATRSELDPIFHAVRSFPVRATFAAYPTYNHPLSLSGCKVVEGYPGHLFSHGIPYQERDTKLQALMLGHPNWLAIATELRVDYLFWGTREDENYPQSLRPWENSCRVVAAGSWGKIYDLCPPQATTEQAN
jgi:hypothetical protein